jgi:hypothetical protein
MAAKKKKHRKPAIKSGRPVPKGLTPVKPGEVRNPKGCPKGLTVLQEIKQLLKLRVKDDKERRTYARAVAQSFVDMARTGSFVHAKEIIEREDGKVSSQIKINDGSDTKLYINIPEED